jgi:hypothetical protein
MGGQNSVQQLRRWSCQGHAHFCDAQTFSIAEISQENGGFARSFGLTGAPFGRCFRVAAAALLAERR